MSQGTPCKCNPTKKLLVVVMVISSIFLKLHMFINCICPYQQRGFVLFFLYFFFFFFACEYSVSMNHVEKTLAFPYWVLLTSLSNTSQPSMCGFISESPFCCIGLCICYYASSILFWLLYIFWWENLIHLHLKWFFIGRGLKLPLC